MTDAERFAAMEGERTRGPHGSRAMTPRCEGTDVPSAHD